MSNSCRKRGTIGALRAASAPWATPVSYLPCSSCPDNRAFPYWTGPCGPTVPVRAGRYEPFNRCGGYPTAGEPSPVTADSVCPAPTDIASLYSAESPLSVHAGGQINLSPVLSTACQARDSEILLPASGVYFASYTMNVPPNVALTTTLRLNLNGESLPCGQTVVRTQGGDETASYTGQAVFHAEAGSALALSTSNRLEIPCGAGEPIFTLALLLSR